MARGNIHFDYGREQALSGVRNRQFVASQLKALRRTASGKPSTAMVGSGPSASTAKSQLAGYKAGMKARAAGGKGGGIKHRPSGTPRGGQFY